MGTIRYGFTQKTPQGKNQQAQTAQEAALEPSQEAHLAEVIPPGALWLIRSRAVAPRRRERSFLPAPNHATSF
jgi:hypothetical protein